MPIQGFGIETHDTKSSIPEGNIRKIIKIQNKYIFVSATQKGKRVDAFLCGDENGNDVDYSFELYSKYFKTEEEKESLFLYVVSLFEDIHKNTKRKQDWEGSLYDYLKPGDYIDDEMYEYLLNVVPPRVHNYNTLVVGTAVDTVDGKNVYMKFIKMYGFWKFKGIEAI